MKLLKILFLVIVVSALGSCENHMDINDIEKGTPTNADTVLPAKHQVFTLEEIDAKQESLPRVYWR